MLSSVTHTSHKAVLPMAPVLPAITLIVLTEGLDERRGSESEVTYQTRKPLPHTEAVLENSKSVPANLVCHCISNTE